MPNPRGARRESKSESALNAVIIDASSVDSESIRRTIQICKNPRFMSTYSGLPYESNIRRMGGTHGIGITKEAARIFHLSPGDAVELILMHINKRPEMAPPSADTLRSISNRHSIYFRLPSGTSLADFDFESVGKTFYLPIYTKISIIGTSYACFVSLEVLRLFGFASGDPIKILIRKVEK